MLTTNAIFITSGGLRPRSRRRGIFRGASRDLTKHRMLIYESVHVEACSQALCLISCDKHGVPRREPYGGRVTRVLLFLVKAFNAYSGNIHSHRIRYFTAA